jgi:hypothetical protein
MSRTSLDLIDVVDMLCIGVLRGVQACKEPHGDFVDGPRCPVLLVIGMNMPHSTLYVERDKRL